MPLSMVQFGTPVASQFAETFFQNNATTTRGVTLSEVILSLLEQAWQHHRIFVCDSVDNWQSEHLPTASDVVRTELLMLLRWAIEFVGFNFSFLSGSLNQS